MLSTHYFLRPTLAFLPSAAMGLIVLCEGGDCPKTIAT